VKAREFSSNNAVHLPASVPDLIFNTVFKKLSFFSKMVEATLQLRKNLRRVRRHLNTVLNRRLWS